jgi:bifunctional UDP-N-acetylglucosamine pyrophosphorylase/glucosamine-1-phosphate N-acetyltransferase
MQTVILAAGRGTRMGDISKIVPKPMLKVNGKTLIEHKIDILPKEVDEIILVVGYLGEQIRNCFGTEFQGKKITYVEDTLEGTGKALFNAKDLLNDRFISMMGDDLYDRKDLEEALKYENAMLVREVEGKSGGGKITLNEKGNLDSIIDDREGKIEGSLIDTGLYVLTKDIFTYEPVQLPNSKEFGLPQTILSMSKDKEIKVVKAHFWLKITDPNDLLIAEKTLQAV